MNTQNYLRDYVISKVEVRPKFRCNLEMKYFRHYSHLDALDAHWTLPCLLSASLPTASAYNNAPLLCAPHLHIRNFARSSSPPRPTPPPPPTTHSYRVRCSHVTSSNLAFTFTRESCGEKINEHNNNRIPAPFMPPIPFLTRSKSNCTLMGN